MSVLVQKGSVQGRSMALAITIALHVALVAGLLAIKVVEQASQSTTPIQVTEIKEKSKPIPVVKPIDPKLLDPRAALTSELPIPIVPIDDSASEPSQGTQITVARPEAMYPALPMVPDTPLRYQVVQSSDDFYPPQAIRMAREGAVVVRACVDAGGRMTGTPKVVRSSHESSLDAAAVRWAKEALRFQPATRAGVAIEACKEFRVSFTLH